MDQCTRFSYLWQQQAVKAQGSLCIHYLHTQSLDVDEGSDKKFRPLAYLNMSEWVLFFTDLILYILVNNFSVMLGQFFLG